MTSEKPWTRINAEGHGQGRILADVLCRIRVWQGAGRRGFRFWRRWTRRLSLTSEKPWTRIRADGHGFETIQIPLYPRPSALIRVKKFLIHHPVDRP